QVQVAADELRFEQLAESPRVQRAALQHRLIRPGRAAGAAVPVTHELLEIDVADLGAVEALHAGGNGIGNLCEHGALFCGRPAVSRWMWIDGGSGPSVFPREPCAGCLPSPRMPAARRRGRPLISLRTR